MYDKRIYCWNENIHTRFEYDIVGKIKYVRTLDLRSTWEVNVILMYPVVYVDQQASPGIQSRWLELKHVLFDFSFVFPLVPHICVSESGQHWFR